MLNTNGGDQESKIQKVLSYATALLASITQFYQPEVRLIDLRIQEENQTFQIFLFTPVFLVSS